MSGESDKEPQDHIRETPRRRVWDAFQRIIGWGRDIWRDRAHFIDLKLSHYVEIGLTLALVFVGLSQLRVYRGQALIMTNQVAISKQSNDISTAAQRAFVTVDMSIEPTTMIVANPKEPGEKISGTWYKPVIENTGTTPTQNLKYIASSTMCGTNSVAWQKLYGDISTVGLAPGEAIQVSLIDNPCPNFQFWPDAPSDPADLELGGPAAPKGVSALLGPRVKHTIGGVSISDDLLQSLVDKGTNWYVDGIIRYNDIFPNSTEHVTKYCYVLGFDLAKDGALHPRASFCQHWNCADKECDADKADYDRHIADAKKAETQQHDSPTLR